MMIFLGILGFLALLITVILLLPVKVIIKNDADNVLILRYRFLFKTFGEDPDPNDPIIRTLKTATGTDRLEKAFQEKQGITKTVTENYDMLKELIKELLTLLKRGTVTRLRIYIRCGGDGADETAIRYGLCCAATYGFLEALRNFVRIRKRGQRIDIVSDFQEEILVFRYDVVVTLRVFRVLAALWRVVWAETKRANAAGKPQQK